MSKFKDRQFGHKLKFEVDTLFKEGDDIIVEGWATKVGVNLVGVDVPTSAYSWDGAFEHFKDMILAFHRDDVSSVGKIESYEIVDGEGLKVRARFFGDNDTLFLRAIQEGTLNGFSIGYEVLEFHEEADDHVFVFDKIKLYEVSVVHIGKSPDALFAIVDSLKTNKTETNKQTFAIHKENQMSKEIEKQLDDIQPAFDKIKADVGDIQENEVARNKLVAEQGKTVDAWDRGEMNDAQAKSVLGKLQPVIDELSEKINKGHSITQAENDMIRISATDMRSALAPYSANVADHAWLLFQSFVDYKDMGEYGAQLLRLRNMHDALLVQVTRARHYGQDVSQIAKTPLFDVFRKSVARFSKPMADAMGSPNTGYGLEFVSENWSAEMQPYTRITGGWLSRLKHFVDVDKLPYQAGVAKSYAGNVNYTDNPDRAKVTNIGTGVTTPSYVSHKVFIPVQDEWEEDSIVAVAPLIRAEIGTALNEGRNRAFLNGDTGTHFDTGRSYVTAYDLETRHNGLRKYVFGATNQATVVRTAAAEGVLTDADILSAIQKLGKKGIKPSEVFVIAPSQLRISLLGLYSTASDYGSVRTKLTGEIQPIYGSDVFIDGEYPTSLNDAGVYDGTTTDRNSLMFVHGPSWGVFSKREIRLEADKDIVSGQLRFVGTLRTDLKQIRADNTTAKDYSASGIEFL